MSLRLEYLHCKGIAWTIEQPSSSLFPFYRPLQVHGVTLYAWLISICTQIKRLTVRGFYLWGPHQAPQSEDLLSSPGHVRGFNRESCQQASSDLQWKENEDLLIVHVLPEEANDVDNNGKMDDQFTMSQHDTREKAREISVSKKVCTRHVSNLCNLWYLCANIPWSIWTSSTCQGNFTCPSEHEVHSYGEEVPRQIRTSPRGF